MRAVFTSLALALTTGWGLAPAVFAQTPPAKAAPAAPADAACPPILNRSFSATADVVIPGDGAEGMVFTQGGNTGGYGLYLRDGIDEGALVRVDDARFDPMWEACAAYDLPVFIHTSDPEAFFQPVDRYNERYEASKPFRRMFVYLTLWWELGVCVYIGAVSAIIWTLEFHYAFGLSLGILFAYIAIWAATTYLYVMWEMKRQDKAYEEGKTDA